MSDYRQHDGGDECQHCDQLTFPMPITRRCQCGATEAHLCAFNAEKWGLAGCPGNRPRSCLLRVDPSTAPFPPGY